MQEAAAVRDNREVAERRNFTWRTVVFGFARSRRKAPRRQAEAEPLFTDWHHPWLFFLAVGSMLLSALDAFLTLQLLALGAVEINPFMAGLIGRGAAAFATVKLALTATGILSLVFLARARFMKRVRAGLFLTFVFGLYACLVCYEFVLLMRLL